MVAQNGYRVHDGRHTPFDKKNHANGRYVHNDKHGMHQQGNIGPAPKFGQKALDVSVPVADKNNIIQLDSRGLPKHRIAIQNGEFVILKSSNDGTYHGYVKVDWDSLEEAEREACKKFNLTKKSGKIIKNEIYY